MKNQTALIDLLNNIVPFRFLPQTEKDRLTQILVPIRASSFQWIYRPGGADDALYLLEDGQVEILDQDNVHVKPANVIRSGHYFGERAALLGQIRQHGVRAITPVLAWSLDAAVFLELIRSYPTFAQSFSSILRDKHGIFLPLEHFKTEIQRGLASGFLNMEKLLPLYRNLDPALHPLAGDSQVMDLGALLYAQRRLPTNTSTVFAWFLTDDIPSSYRQPSKYFPSMAIATRRRGVWEMTKGKNLVLLRTGITDVLDFISNLCLFSLEAKKIRLRLNDPDILLYLQSFVQQSAGKAVDPEEVFAFLETLPYSETENRGLMKVWGVDTPQRLLEIAFHHEDFVVVTERQIDNYNNRQTEKWVLQISRAVKKLLGCDPGELPPEWEVHIISSNTHSVVNCLSPFWHLKKAAILFWAQAQNHSLLKNTWSCDEDLLYSLIPDYMAAHPLDRPLEIQELEWGILQLEDAGYTGINVQLLDLAKLTGQPRDLSLQTGRASEPDKGAKKLIVNVDYAFGEQAEEIFRNLITLFQHRITSFSIMGKAGALKGRRGDVLLPTSFLNQINDQVLPVDAWTENEISTLKKTLSHTVEVHAGPLLTVEGTLLQNRALLHFYQNLWQAVGLEMEGWYFAQQIQQARLTGLLAEGVRERYGYYVSDNPLDQEANLSSAMSALEGIPPLYALTRHFLRKILEID